MPQEVTYSKYHNIILLIIILTAIITRFVGIKFGLPYFVFYTDEGLLFDPMFKILKTGDINPHEFTYPSFYIYLQAIIAYIYYIFSALGSASYGSVSEIPQHELFLVGRALTALFGVSTIVLTYGIGKKIFNPRIGLLSAGIITATFVHVLYSQYIKNDIPALFFGLISLFFSYYIIEQGRLKFYILSGFFVGLAAATGYNGAFFVVPIFTAHVLRNVENRKIRAGTFFSLSITLAVVAVLLGFFTGCPYCVIDYSEFAGSVWIKRLLEGNPLNPADLNVMLSNLDGTPGWLWHIKYLASSGLYYPIFITTLGGIILSLLNRDKKKAFVFSFPIVYSLFLISGILRTDRLSIPLTPFFAMFSAIFLAHLVDKIELKSDIKDSYKKILVFLVLLIAIGIPLLRIFVFNYTISQPDTREIAAKWIESNVPKDSLVFAVGQSRSSGMYLQDKGFMNVLNLFPMDINEIFRYPGEIAIVSDLNYNIAYNYRNRIEYEETYMGYVMLYENGELIKKFSNPLSEKEFFSPISLEWGSIVASYNPTIRVLRIPNLNLSLFNKTLYAEDMKQYSGMTLVADESSPTGLALFTKKSESSGYGGPYTPFPAGSYDVIYYFKTSNTTDIEEEVASLSVEQVGSGKVYASKKIFAKDFYKTGEYQEFKLSFNLTKGDRLQLFVISSGMSDLWVSKIEIIQR